MRLFRFDGMWQPLAIPLAKRDVLQTCRTPGNKMSKQDKIWLAKLRGRHGKV